MNDETFGCINDAPFASLNVFYSLHHCLLLLHCCITTRQCRQQPHERVESVLFNAILLHCSISPLRLTCVCSSLMRVLSLLPISSSTSVAESEEASLLPLELFANKLARRLWKNNQDMELKDGTGGWREKMASDNGIKRWYGKMVS